MNQYSKRHESIVPFVRLRFATRKRWEPRRPRENGMVSKVTRDELPGDRPSGNTRPRR